MPVSPCGADGLRLCRKKTLATEYPKSAQNKKACAQLDQGTWFWYGRGQRFAVIPAINIAAFISARIYFRACGCAANEKAHAENKSRKRRNANN
jgi:hypothetical protein